MIEMPALVPELDVADLATSLTLYCDVFGFELMVDRPEEGFAYLARATAHIMLQEAEGPGRRFRTAPLERPYGRGINLQIAAVDVDGLYDRVGDTGLAIIVPIEERWYRQGAVCRGNRQFVVADPDGYLLRFYDDLGMRPPE